MRQISVDAMGMMLEHHCISLNIVDFPYLV